jgi:hypothetical protein
MDYKSHDEIPAKYRRVILDETLLKRVSKVSLEECNEIIEDFIQFEKSCQSLQKYEVIVSRDGRTAKYEFTEPDDALRKLDEIIGYFTKDRNVKAILKQADRIIRGYINGRWVHPAPKDKIMVKPLVR